MCNENIEIVSSSYVYTVSGSVQIFINGDDGSSDREDDVEHSCLNAIIEFITSTEFTTEGMTPPFVTIYCLANIQGNEATTKKEVSCPLASHSPLLESGNSSHIQKQNG